MALPVLDGNQSATTLSSVVTGGEHIVAHTVVSLGSTAISNITNAVSGSVVSISNFPSTQTIAGTVTANDSGALSIVNSSTVTKADVKFTAIAGAYNASEFASTYSLRPLSTNSGGTLLIDGNVAGSSILSYDGWAHVRVAQSPGSVVTVGSLPAISGTVTVSNATTASAVFVKICGEQSGAGSNEAREIQTDDGGFLYVRLTDPSVPGSKAVIYDPVAGNSYVNVRQTASVTIGSLPAISGTVTANGSQSWIDPNAVTVSGFLPVGGWDVVNSQFAPIPLNDAATAVQVAQDPASAFNVIASGTVTAAAPNGSLTTRFGTPTTANTAFATSAVTNANRKYLLIQNVTTGSNVITVGIGFTPTTTQGIQLTAGAGITFESSYIPTGAVYVLSSVTASNFTILEA